MILMLGEQTSLFDIETQSAPTDFPVSENKPTFETQKPSPEMEELLLRRRRQFLVHSYIYYRLDEALISDAKYDQICKDLASLQTKYPDLGQNLPFHDICSKIDESASGFFIKDYPLEIAAKACRLVASRTHQPLAHVLSRVGLRVMPWTHS